MKDKKPPVLVLITGMIISKIYYNLPVLSSQFKKYLEN